MLYRPIGTAASAPSESGPTSYSLTASAEPPGPENIDVITFGVASDHIGAFFASYYDFPYDGGLSIMFGLLKFGKPFRPILRHLDRLRAHLTKLERMYGGINPLQS